MTYLHCPRCRLAIRRRVDYLTMINCPRCLARTATAVPLFASPLNAMELREGPVPVRQQTAGGDRRMSSAAAVLAGELRTARQASAAQHENR